MGNVLGPDRWCRQKWCREDASAEHFAGDGCSCDGHGRECDLKEPRLTVLTAKASRLAPFACRACGARARRMVEQPEMFFRCEPCAEANRWPTGTTGRY